MAINTVIAGQVLDVTLLNEIISATNTNSNKKVCEFVGSLKWSSPTPVAGASFGSSTTSWGIADNAAMATLTRTTQGSVIDSSSGVRPEITIQNMKPGRYIISPTSSSGEQGLYSSATGNAYHHYSITDGTNRIPLNGGGYQSHAYSIPSNVGNAQFDILTDGVTRTYVIEHKTGGSNPQNGYIFNANENGIAPWFEISVYRFPLA